MSAKKPTIDPLPDDPCVVSGGPALLETGRGEGASKEHFILCRCGGSKNKPFCDGTHWHTKVQGRQKLATILETRRR